MSYHGSNSLSADALSSTTRSFATLNFSPRRRRATLGAAVDLTPRTKIRSPAKIPVLRRLLDDDACESQSAYSWLPNPRWSTV